MNRWRVYEHIKQVFMMTGQPPNREAIYHRFKGMPKSEINEGIIEFELATKRKIEPRMEIRGEPTYVPRRIKGLYAELSDKVNGVGG